MAFSEESFESAATGRRLYIGGDKSRTPMYFVINGTRVPVTSSNGKDCWSVYGELKDVGTHWTEEGEYASVQKVTVNLDMGDEIIQLVTGVDTHTAKCILQCLSIAAASKEGLQKYVKFAFKRGDKKPTAVFCQVSGKSEDGQWKVIDTRDNPSFDHDKTTETVEQYCLRLLDRLMINGEAEETEAETFEYVATDGYAEDF